MEKLKVESYSGYKAGERPLRFWINGRQVEIISIEKSWLTPEGRYFKVLGDNNCVYTLEYKETDNIWNLVTLN